MRESLSQEWTHHFVSIDGVNLHWVELGQGSGKPVVMLHGLHDCHLTWKPVASLIGVDRRVLLLDLPGHGMSSRPDCLYDLPWYTQVVGAWMRSLDLTQANVVGHSLGGGIAQMLLLECPERIRRLVLAAPGGLGHEITPLLRLASVPFAVERLGQPFFALGTRLALRGVLDPGDLAELCRLNRRAGSARAFARTVRDLVGWRGQRRRFSERAHELRHLPPVALLWGERDWVIPAKHAEALAELLEGLRTTLLPECGHYLHHQQPRRFAKVVRDFLDDPSVTPVTLRRSSAITAKQTTLERPFREPSAFPTP